MWCEHWKIGLSNADTHTNTWKYTHILNILMSLKVYFPDFVFIHKYIASYLIMNYRI